MKLLALLRSKNRALSRLIELTSALVLRLQSSDWNILSEMLDSRESMVKALELFNRDIERLSQTDLEIELMDLNTKKKAIELISTSEEMKIKLRELDDVLVNLLEKEQLETQKEISKNKTFSQTVSKFKSSAR
ncbi:MAG: hypothetical protein KA715_03120 [Xanthomonadaceae bacterium]|nr:hypothetical protein [Xanthomonadaceae bacterium]